MPASNSATPTFETAAQVIDHILVVHHPFVRREIPKLLQLAQRGDDPIVLHQVSNLAGEMTSHMEKEEQILFPMIVEMEKARRERRAPSIMMCGPEGPIEQMKYEHTQAKGTIGQLEPLLAEARYAELREAMNGFREDLEVHSGLEESVLFPWALRLLE